MPEVSLTAAAGRTTGSRSSNRLRAEGQVPAVLYGHGSDPIPVSVGRRELRAALTTEAGFNALINLTVDGDQHLTIVRDIQRDPVRREVTHVDFILVNRDEEVTVEVPIVLEGEAEAVRVEGGTVDQQLYALSVDARPGSIPNEITVDISGMEIGDTIRVSDLTLPSGAATSMDPEYPVAVAMVTRATIEAEELAEEGEEAEAATERAEGGVVPPEAESAGETEGSGES